LIKFKNIPFFMFLQAAGEHKAGVECLVEVLSQEQVLIDCMLASLEFLQVGTVLVMYLVE
jgi:hypothetical protein